MAKGKEFDYQSSTFDERDIVNKMILNYSKGNIEKNYIPIPDEFESNKEENEFSIKDEDQFVDYLEIPVISGQAKGMANPNTIDAERIEESGNFIGLKDVHFKHQGHSHDEFSTVIINRNTDGQISGVDVICRCGVKTRLNFAFNPDTHEFTVSESNKVQIKDPGVDPLVIDEDLDHHIYEEAGNYEMCEDYHNSLLEDMEKLPEEENDFSPERP